MSVFFTWDVALALTLSFVPSLVASKGYKETHRGISYSQSYVHALVITAVVISVIVLTIDSKIARAF